MRLLISANHSLAEKQPLQENSNPCTSVGLPCVDAPDCDCLGNEPVMDGEELIGVTTGGAYGHTVSQTCLCYVPPVMRSPGPF